MAYVTIVRHGAVAQVTISRPEALNALNTEVLAALEEAFAGLAKDDSVRAVVLTGEGKAFVAGADIAEMRGFSPTQAQDYAARGAAVFAAIEALPQPVIAAVNGFALGGGCELALACDIRLASERAKFGQPEVSLGVIPGFGGTQRLPRAVGLGEAMRLILGGQAVGAAEALRIGLVQGVYAPEALLDEASALAQTIAKNAPLAVRAAKQAMREGMDMPLAKGIAMEGRAFAACFDTADQREGMAAFVEKRRPGPFEGK